MKRILSILLIVLILLPYLSYGETLSEENSLMVRHILEAQDLIYQTQLRLDEDLVVKELVDIEVFFELDEGLSPVEFLAIALDGQEITLEEVVSQGEILEIFYKLVDEGDEIIDNHEALEPGQEDLSEEDDGDINNQNVEGKERDFENDHDGQETIASPQELSWTKARYSMIPFGPSFRGVPSSINVEVFYIDPSGSWAFYHVWDKTEDPINGSTSTFAYFVLEDGSYAFCLNPGKMAPSGSLPVLDISSTDFRRFAEKLATLALSSGGIPGYSFEENYVFAQVYLWRKIPFNDGEPGRFQVEFRYQHSPYETNWETDERFNNWKLVIDDLMENLDQISFNGEEIELEVGKEIRLTDKNNQLSHYNIKNNTDGLSVNSNGSSLIIVADRPLEAKVEFWQARTDYPIPEMSYILKGPDDTYQDLGVFRDPYVNSINIKVVESSSKVKIFKKNQLDEPIEGAVFELAADENFTAVLEALSTDEQGMGQTKDYKADEYKKLFIREKSVPHPYIKSDEVRQVDLEPGKTHTVDFINTFKPAKIRVVKKDQEGNPIGGAVFQISSSLDFKEILAEASSSSEGELVFSGLDILKHKIIYLKEKEVPEPYILDNTIHKLELEAGEELVKELVNKAKEVSLKKTDIVTGLPVAGAIIELTDAKGEKREYKTSSSGQVTIKGIASGSYRFREILAPKGYVLNEESFSFYVDQAGKVDGIIDFTNEPTRLRVSKKDEKGGALEGAGFSIYLDNGDKLRAIQVQEGHYFADLEGDTEVFYTDSAGRFLVDYLPQGSYLVKEATCPKGYILEDEGQTIVVDEKGGVEEDLIFVNKPTRVVLKKTDIVTGQAVVGAKVIVTREDWKAEYLTDDKGQVEIIGLEPGTYTFKEELAPHGYLLNDQSFEFILNPDGSVDGIKDFTNEPTRLRVIKKDRESGRTLEGAGFEIYSLENDQQIMVAYEKESDRYLASLQGQGLMVTNEKGEIILDYLPIGRYLLVEKNPPKGYILGDLEVRSYEVVVGEHSGLEVEALEIYNDITKVVLKKYDAYTMQALSGAKIRVEGADFEKVFTSDKRGEIVIEGLVPGPYSYKEIEAPKGYVLNQEELSFVLTENGLISGICELKNEPTKLVVKKTGSEKKPLEGVVFQIIDGKGNPVKLDYDEIKGIYLASDKGRLKSLKTNDKGEFTLLYLAKGDYTIKEILVPQGYLVMEDLKFSLGDQPLELELTNVRELPKTGQAKTSHFLVMGLVLLFLGKKLAFRL